MEPIISKMPVHVALCALGFWMLKGYGFRRTQAVDVRGSWEEGTKVKSCLWTGLGLCQEDLPPLPTQCTLGCQQQTGGPGAVWTGLFPLQSLLSSNLKIVRIYFIKEGGISLFPIKIRAFLIFFKFPSKSTLLLSFFFFLILFWLCRSFSVVAMRSFSLIAMCGLLTVVASLVQSMGSRACRLQ